MFFAGALVEQKISLVVGFRQVPVLQILYIPVSELKLG